MRPCDLASAAMPDGGALSISTAVYGMVEEFVAVRPDMDVLFISGYPAEMIDRKGILDDEAQLILKPVSPSELLRKIREILDRKR